MRWGSPTACCAPRTRRWDGRSQLRRGGRQHAVREQRRRLVRRGPRWRHRRVRRLHACDQGAASRHRTCGHDDARAGAALFNSNRLQHLPRDVDHDVKRWHADQRQAFTVPAALGNKIIHPYSDFLLHDIGTGDGIVQNGGQSTANKIRTVTCGERGQGPPHARRSVADFTDAILRHAGEATGVTNL